MRLFVQTSDVNSDIFTVDEHATENEIAFEAHVLKCLTLIYPRHRCFVFTGSFELENVVKKPDLALVARDFSHWFVIEVELLTHSLEKHVIPQMRVIRYGEAQEDCLQVLSREMEVTQGVARTLLDRVPRTTAVVANGYDAAWASNLRTLQVQYLSLCPFRSTSGLQGFDLAGDLEVINISLGFGVFDATLSTLRMSTNTEIAEGVLQLKATDGTASEWIASKTKEALWLFKKRGKLNLKDGCYVQLVKTYSGEIVMRV